MEVFSGILILIAFWMGFSFGRGKEIKVGGIFKRRGGNVGAVESFKTVDEVKEEGEAERERKVREMVRDPLKFLRRRK